MNGMNQYKTELSSQNNVIQQLQQVLLFSSFFIHSNWTSSLVYWLNETRRYDLIGCTSS